MIKSLLFLLLLAGRVALFGQSSFSAVIQDSETNEPLAGATAVVSGSNLGGIADASGRLTIDNIPDGIHILVFSYIGYRQTSDTLKFPLPGKQVFTILMESVSEEIEEVVISSTRSTRTIENIPTRVEFIAGEELDEKGNMKPGDIRMMLNESTGIQTQQTSATSYNSSIRIQGLDGRYTQLLRDGLPLYSGYSGGLSLLQIVPLDLKQVEVVKGASSTLYGGGAIAGLVNLISKTPGENTELNFLLNGTSALGLDASGFYSQKYGKTGATMFTSYNYGNPYDPAGIGLTAIPEFKRFTLNPRLFMYFNESSVLSFGINSTFEDRTGGDIRFIQGRGEPGSWYERNTTTRLSSQAVFESELSDRMKLTMRNSIGYYDRTLELPDFTFAGKQTSSYSEAVLSSKGEITEWITGVNLITDNFSQGGNSGASGFDYNHLTIGGFIQNTWNIFERVNLESGLRTDYQDDYGFFTLPRLSILYKAGSKFSFRAGGGMGYKIPTVFTEDAEKVHFRNILPFDFQAWKPERSYGGNFDVNFKTPLSENVYVNLNTLLFYTRINDPMTLAAVTQGQYRYIQPDGFIDTRGAETNIRLTCNDMSLFLGYTLADVEEHHDDVISDYPLVARHRLNNILMYEIEDRLRVGLEAYYFSRQNLSDGAAGKEHWIFGLMIEKMWEKFSLFLNFENITDTRQTRFDTIFTGPVTDPVFRDIYAPVDGFVINGGFKIRVF
ncbi:MAG TPA: TonB-dependent receptor [Bacteroidales bacterium]|nr:TonB-dependent receptor [Bacteroidales bacterium]